MLKDRNFFYIFLAWAGVTVYYLVAEYLRTGHQMGVPLDDTWIHFRFAENFAAGHFFEYNINEPTPGTTSPLWVIILSFAFLLKLNPVYFSLLLGSLFFFLTCVEVYKLCLKLKFEKITALFAALLTVLCGRLIWSSLSGMEITLFCFLILLAANRHLNEIRDTRISVITGLLLGLACVTRPEGLLFAAIYYFVSSILLKDKKNFSVSIILFLVVVIPYPAFSYVQTGGILPNTFEAQGGGLKLVPNLVFLRETGKLFVRDNLVILVLWFVAIVYFIRSIVKKIVEKDFLLINLWIILLPLVSSVLVPNWRHHGRYLIPLIPFMIIASLYTATKIYNRIKEREAGSLLRNAALIRNSFVVITFLLTFISTAVYADALGWNAENINDQQVKVGNWLKENLPNEQVFGMNDIGAITYITKKRTIDMAGLITPVVFKYQKMSEPEGNAELMKLLKENNVNYIIIYPEWYAYLAEKYSGSLEKKYSAYLENNTIAGGKEMVVYRIDWEKVNR